MKIETEILYPNQILDTLAELFYSKRLSFFSISDLFFKAYSIMEMSFQY